MTEITYMLRERNAPESGAGEYYAVISPFVDTVLEEAVSCGISDICNTLQEYVAQANIEALRSKEEYLLELLMIGVLGNVYIPNARWLPKPLFGIFTWLYHIRNKSSRLKPMIDCMRGILTFLLRKKETSGKAMQSLQDYSKLIDWLDATGEYKEEVKRLRNWESFFCHESESTSAYLAQIMEFGRWFKRESQIVLGTYTVHVDVFLQGEYKQYSFREDALFCGRQEVEYHLNMVGATIMNRAFRQEFNNTKQIVVLLPLCMSEKANGGCKANRSGWDVICTGCTDSCNINQIRKLGLLHDFSVRIVPHSSGFTNWLKQWRDQKDTGLVAVACILNLVRGGYEMKNLNIPAQCVFLDYCGCKKHWCREGVATGLDVRRLLAILKKKPKRQIDSIRAE